MKLLAIGLLILVIIVFVHRALADAPPSLGPEQSIYDFTVKTIDGAQVSLADYRGQALLIVNTASRCGFTPQYAGLEKLYERYKSRGLAVLARVGRVGLGGISVGSLAAGSIGLRLAVIGLGGIGLGLRGRGLAVVQHAREGAARRGARLLRLRAGGPVASDGVDGGLGRSG